MSWGGGRGGSLANLSWPALAPCSFLFCCASALAAPQEIHTITRVAVHLALTGMPGVCEGERESFQDHSFVPRSQAATTTKSSAPQNGAPTSALAAAERANGRALHSGNRQGVPS